MKENINLLHFLFLKKKIGGGVQTYNASVEANVLILVTELCLFLHRVYEFGVAFQVTVIEEAVKYIDELHRALFERLQSKGNIHRN